MHLIHCPSPTRLEFKNWEFTVHRSDEETNVYQLCQQNRLLPLPAHNHKINCWSIKIINQTISWAMSNEWVGIIAEVAALVTSVHWDCYYFLIIQAVYKHAGWNTDSDWETRIVRTIRDPHDTTTCWVFTPQHSSHPTCLRISTMWYSQKKIQRV